MTDFERVMSYREIKYDSALDRIEKRKQQDYTITSITEEELMKLAKCYWRALKGVVDKSIITKKIVDNITIYNSECYHIALEGVNPECISKEKAMAMLVYDPKVYGLLTKELQNDSDILEILSNEPLYLPEELFNNKTAINYILDKYNVKGKSWAVYRTDYQCLTIKPDINDSTHYIIYQFGRFYGSTYFPTSKEFQNRKFRNIFAETAALTFEFRLFPAIASKTTHLK